MSPSIRSVENESRMFPIVGLAAMVVATVAANWVAYGPTFIPQNSSSALTQIVEASGAPIIGGPFNLSDDQGQPVSEKSLVGDKYHLIFFGFANCPDICPGMLMLMAGVESKLPEAVRNKLQFVFVSVDPDRDSLEKLGAYVRGFSPRFVGWTGPREEIDKMVKGYLAYYAIRPVEAERDAKDYQVDHSGFAYLMGPDGRYVAHYRSSDSATALQTALEQAIQ